MVKTFNTTGVSKSGGSGIGMLIGVLALAGIGYLIYTSTKKKKEEQKPTYEI
jgi:hypothetical protein